MSSIKQSIIHNLDRMTDVELGAMYQYVRSLINNADPRTLIADRYLQPMDTVPTDGTQVLLKIGNLGYMTGRLWHDEIEMDCVETDEGCYAWPGANPTGWIPIK